MSVNNYFSGISPIEENELMMGVEERYNQYKCLLLSAGYVE
jgi:hypothetical protein